MARRMFYLDELRSGRAWIRGETAEHVCKVLRARPGQRFALSDGFRFHTGELESLSRDEVEFRIIESRAAAPAPLEVHLLASLIKFDHFEWMLEKATELGVDRITPVNSLRSEKGLDKAALKRMERWRRIVRESGQQCRRLRPPEIGEPVELNRALGLTAERRLWLEEECSAPPILTAAPETGEVALLSGPEGGWDDRERAGAARSGWHAVSLGPQVLRAETACLAALAVLNARATAAAQAVK